MNFCHDRPRKATAHWRWIPILVIADALPWAAAAQTPLKVYISADMEGIDGVVSQTQTSSSGSEYEKYRRLMTLEVNAAVEGACDAGAAKVVVSDSHGNAQNIDLELLDKRATLIRGWPRPLGMVHALFQPTRVSRPEMVSILALVQSDERLDRHPVFAGESI